MRGASTRCSSAALLPSLLSKTKHAPRGCRGGPRLRPPPLRVLPSAAIESGGSAPSTSRPSMGRPSQASAVIQLAGVVAPKGEAAPKGDGTLDGVAGKGEAFAQRGWQGEGVTQGERADEGASLALIHAT
mmetsp:Transcript_24082/g.54796  ORF Transcript_24082/g.54796 Transcript_24082/m.54796 type:complete len:130 (-) Transcript_24082:651-1040(-)